MGNKLQHGHVDADDGGTLSSSIGIVPTGAILPFGGSSSPSGYLLCDGSAVSRTTYSALFTAIGTAFGIGDGSTTFNVPDLQGRSPLGSGNGSGLTSRSIGQTGGEENHTLSISEMPVHSHDPINRDIRTSPFTGSAGVSCLAADNTSGTMYAINSNNVGNGSSHNTMHPFAVTNFIIKT